MRFFGLDRECLGWMLALQDRISDHTSPEVEAGFWIGMGEISQRG